MIPNYEEERCRMVADQLIRRQIKSEAVLDAMRSVPRHLFIPENMIGHAYDDSPMPIGWGQTISQPYIVAYMTELLEPAFGLKVLEIGAGSGYQAAVLAHLGCDVYSIEYVEKLAVGASKILADLGYGNVKVRHGNGYNGWQEEAPFDAVIVTAAPEDIPESLIAQLAEGGMMIVPVGRVHSVQSLMRITKKDGKLTGEDLLPVRFVPMVR
jgi:protein-L-isoaspartate(D-aspartate) O-methyltransferase